VEREGFQAALHETQARVVVRQIDADEEVRAVPGVCEHDRVGRDPVCDEPGADVASALERSLVLSVGAGDPRGPRWVEVNEYPAPAKDIAVTGCLLRILDDPIPRARE
jgi:hypothetical protein